MGWGIGGSPVIGFRTPATFKLSSFEYEYLTVSRRIAWDASIGVASVVVYSAGNVAGGVRLRSRLGRDVWWSWGAGLFAFADTYSLIGDDQLRYGFGASTRLGVILDGEEGAQMTSFYLTFVPLALGGVAERLGLQRIGIPIGLDVTFKWRLPSR